MSLLRSGQIANALRNVYCCRLMLQRHTFILLLLLLPSFHAVELHSKAPRLRHGGNLRGFKCGKLFFSAQTSSSLFPPIYRIYFVQASMDAQSGPYVSLCLRGRPPPSWSPLPHSLVQSVQCRVTSRIWPKDGWGDLLREIKFIPKPYTAFFSQLRAKLRDWAVRPVRAGCYSWAALSFIDSRPCIELIFT